MLTTFRDGLQSALGGKVRLNDVVPAMEAATSAGIRHFEFGGGARFQAPYFYVGENPFECMSRMREVAGLETDLQILTRSVSGVTLTTQRPETLALQANLMKKHGTTWDRNFDYMNDVDNLAQTGQPIVDAGMHHQVCIALMGLPFHSNKVHTPDFYIDVIRRLLKKEVHFDSVCLKDASGTADPRTCYETARGLKKILPPEVPLWQHTHDTASLAIPDYMAGIEGGVDGIDLSVRPLASGTVQPDVRSMAHALKGTGYRLDVDPNKMPEIEHLLSEGLENYQFSPVTIVPDARVVAFPMPGGAIGPNIHMMTEAGIEDKYSDVLAEFPVVVKAAGAWTSVTPGSQQYWLQAFNNVLYGRWNQINDGFGRGVLGYFGKPPLSPDPEVVQKASEQLGLDPYEGNPLEAAPDTLDEARKALKTRDLPETEENLFLVAAAMVPGRNPELNEGLRLLTGKPNIVLPLKEAPPPKEEFDSKTPTKKEATSAPRSESDAKTNRFSTVCTVEEGSTSRKFRVTIEIPETESPNTGKNRSDTSPTKNAESEVGVFSPFEGNVDVVEIRVNEGDSIQHGQIVASVEAMKAKHDVRAPCDGRVLRIDSPLGTKVTGRTPILTLEKA